MISKCAKLTNGKFSLLISSVKKNSESLVET